MPERWTNWSESFTGYIERMERPTSLNALVLAIQRAETERLAVHAQGSKWAFSAPAYCPGVMVDTHGLNRFHADLQDAVIQRSRADRLLVAVEGGITIRNLYLGLAGLPRDDGAAPLSWWLRRRPRWGPARPWALMTQGGASGQTLAGAVSTGTHGGDVARPPIGDTVRAILLVGTGGHVRLVQRASDRVVDVPRLARSLRRHVEAVDDDEAFQAAILSVGRFGIAYAYVVEVESGEHVFEERRQRSDWPTVRASLLGRIAAARAQDEFLQVLLSPPPSTGGTHVCFVTTRRRVAAPPPGVQHVLAARAAAGASADVMANLCGTVVTPELRTLQTVLEAFGWFLVLRVPVWGFLLAQPFFRASASIGRIGPYHRLGDAVAEIINMATSAGRFEVIDMVTSAILENAQREWRVWGRRYELSDLVDPNGECYRGDSVELFFPVDAELPRTLDMVVDVLRGLRRDRMPIGGYVALRFMAPSEALLALASGGTTCSVEVSLLRGLNGNPEALRRLQELALQRRGQVHWGQQHDLTRAQVANRFGDRLRRWKAQLERLEGRSRTFSTPFTRARGLEVDAGASWRGWTGLGLRAASPPAVVGPRGRRPMTVFALDGSRQVVRRAWPPGAGPVDWRPVRPGSMGGKPVVCRSVDGRIELFVRDGPGRIRRCWQEGEDEDRWSDWDTLGGGDGPTMDSDPSVAAHTDGRLELFARGDFRHGHRLYQAYAVWVNSFWSSLFPEDEERLQGPPSACLRSHMEGASATDQLLVAATDLRGRVMFRSQHGPGGRTGWHAWAHVRPPGGSILTVPSTSMPLATFFYGEGARTRILAIDARGDVQE
ncbi:MAG TPA: D-arabinono-1,4-lactone oxidase, partial [Candidatus Thermoplasmatota archaeon]|nr:D-arabinono-1,4-lactone oxidase [Candidatus Thermoplasmatota archaeon]